MDDLPKRLKQRRRERDMSQGQVAAILGVSQEMIAKLEAGERDGDSMLRGLVNRWIATGQGPHAGPKPKRGAYAGYRSTRR